MRYWRKRKHTFRFCYLWLLNFISHIYKFWWLYSCHLTLQSILAMNTKIWVVVKEKAVTILPIMEGGVIKDPMDGIVLREQQERKCQQHVCQHTGVVQPTLAGWMVPILQWKMVKFSGRSALVIILWVANTIPKFLWRTAHPTISTNFMGCHNVRRATVAQTEYAERSLRDNRIHSRCILGKWRHDL